MNRSWIWLCLLAALLLGGPFFPVAIAKPNKTPPCKGADFFAYMEANLPDTLKSITELVQARTPNADAVFWQIEGNGLAEPSWLLGTLHVTDRRLVDLPEETEAAFRKARTVALEIGDIGNGWRESFGSLFELPFRYLPENITWDLYFSRRELSRVDYVLGKYGYRLEHVDRFQPWVIMLEFMYPMCEYVRASEGLDYLDMDLAKRARKLGKEVIGLETFYSSAKIIAEVDLDTQFLALLAVVKLTTIPEDDYEEMIQVYLRRILGYYDLTEPFDLTDRERAALATFDTYTVDKRNLVMRDHALPLIAKGNVFIAVGVAHLPGENGLVELLREAGYTLTPVN